MPRRAARHMLDLLPAGDAVGHNRQAGVGRNRRHQPVLADFLADFIMLGLVAEVTGHPEAAEGNFGHLVPHSPQHRHRLFDIRQRLLVAAQIRLRKSLKPTLIAD